MRNKKQLLTLFLVFLSLMYSNAQSKTSKKPNVLIIQVDDLGFDDLALHGNLHTETPNLDALGKQSVQFKQFYTASACAPTRAALLTGRNFNRVGVSGVHAGREYINLEEILIAESFKKAGYSTGMWGKWHSGKVDGYFPWDRGFDEAFYASLYNYFDNTGLMNGKELDTKGYITDVITDMAISFIQKNKDKPFFAYLSHLAPHGPWRAPEKDIQKYRDKGLSKPLSTLYAMIDNVDTNTGRLMKMIKKLGLEENTIIVFLSDNGPSRKGYKFRLTQQEWIQRNASGLRGGKGVNWENGIKSPLFIQWKGQFSAKTIKEPVKVEDLYPTLLGLTGIKKDKKNNFDGDNITPLLKGEPYESNPIFIAHHKPFGLASFTNKKDPKGLSNPLTKKYTSTFNFENQLLAIRKGKYKYVQDGEGKKPVLFDLSDNPKEWDSKSINDKDIKTELASELKQWYTEIKNAPNSFTMPVFQIGYDKNAWNQITAFAPAAISSNLNNKEHFLANWQKEGDWASYNINVVTSGVYEVFVVYEIQNAKDLQFEVAVGNKKTAGKLIDSKDREFGTLIENAANTWNDMDNKNSFRNSIKKSSLGKIKLSKKDKTLKLLLKEVANSHKGKWRDVVISIQLERTK